MPEVLNKKIGGPAKAQLGPDQIYIGRPSKWGNPFVIGRDGTREQVVYKYEEWIKRSVLMDDIEELRGKDLVCWCAPLPCHGDVLLRLGNA